MSNKKGSRGSLEKAPGKNSGKQKLRIIGGEWRSRQIDFPLVSHLRPTPDRVRETLFNWLRNDIHGARCLEPFAGSGILSLEALSRGAKHVVMLDLANAAIQTIRSNLSTLGADQQQYHLEAVDARQWMNNYTGAPFDLIFLDPPFADKDLIQIATQLTEALAPGGHIYAETPAAIDESSLPDGLALTRQKQAGAVHYALLRRK